MAEVSFAIKAITTLMTSLKRAHLQMPDASKCSKCIECIFCILFPRKFMPYLQQSCVFPQTYHIWLFLYYFAVYLNPAFVVENYAQHLEYHV